MQDVQEFNLLMLGRSGAGKSATTKFLTSNPSITTRNGLQEVTKQVTFYQGSAFEVAGRSVRFRVLDIPGLDRSENRLRIRANILQQLEQHKLSIHGILYVSSLTQRDTGDSQRLFRFLAELPWSSKAKCKALIPILTKYDNLVFDSKDETQTTIQEFRKLFKKGEQELAWTKRVYWSNPSKNLELKMNQEKDIRLKHEHQVERLIKMIKKSQMWLTVEEIRELIAKEDKFVLRQLMLKMEKRQIAAKNHIKSHKIKLQIQIKFKHTKQGFGVTGVAAMMVNKFSEHIPKYGSLLIIGIPLGITCLQYFFFKSQVFLNKQIQQNSSGEQIIQSYEHLCSELNREMEREWIDFNDSLRFDTSKRVLTCRTALTHYKFIDIQDMELSFQNRAFSKNIEKQKISFTMDIPEFKEAQTWAPVITVSYSLRKLDDSNVLRHIEQFRKDFWNQI